MRAILAIIMVSHLLGHMSLSPNSLNRYAYSVYSQNGEDGIIEEIFRRLQIEKGFFADFGAADGIALSNTRYLWEKGWSGAMIDESVELVAALKENYKDAKNVLCLRYRVVDGITHFGFTFDRIAKRHFPNQEIDFLSIDIDGLDYLILKGLKCRPKVICVEANLYWHPLFTKEVPEEVAGRNLQQPLAVMIRIGRELGYEPIALTINLFLVRKDLYAPFQVTPSDPVTLWRDAFLSNPCKECILDHRQSNPLIHQYEDVNLEPITDLLL